MRVDSAPDPVPEGMTFVPAHPGGYLIPHDRVAFGATETLLHGGLTPEEVLIPFILITRQDRGAAAALQLTPIETRAHAATEGWYVRLCLVNTTRETFVNLKIVAQAPFSGDSPVFPRLEPHDRIEEVILNLRASIEQQGPTQVSFELRYQEGRQRVISVGCSSSIWIWRGICWNAPRPPSSSTIFSICSETSEQAWPSTPNWTGGSSKCLAI